MLLKTESIVIFLCLVKPIIFHKQFTSLQKEHSKMIERNKLNSVGCRTGKLKNHISRYHFYIFFPSWCSCNVLFTAWRVSVGADKSRFKSEGCLGQLLSAAYTASAGASKTEDTVMWWFMDSLNMNIQPRATLINPYCLTYIDAALKKLVCWVQHGSWYNSLSAYMLNRCVFVFWCV